MGNYNTNYDYENTFFIGMDVHKNTISLITYHLPTNKYSFESTIPTDYKLILSYIENLDNYTGNCATFVCGYEAGCLGFALQRKLETHGVKCIILAPTTMHVDRTRVKTDKRDARVIAHCLATNGYKPVHIPTLQDEQIKNLLRMIDDHKVMLKKVKQQILSFCLKNGYEYSGKGHWNNAHLKWLKELQPSGLDEFTLTSYLTTYYTICGYIDSFINKIEELAKLPDYKESVEKLSCFLGIKTYTAMSIIVEVSDFSRFENARNFSAYLGLCPGYNVFKSVKHLSKEYTKNTFTLSS